MILCGLKTFNGEINDLTVSDDKISRIGSADDAARDKRIHFETGSRIYPGLINSHDHLDFNIFPPLGNYIYKNYLEWGKDIHRQNKALIDAVLQVPKPLRTHWGIYKNLIAGVTTVVQHGEKLPTPDNLIGIHSDCVSLHSVALEKRWKLKLNKPFRKNKKVVIHIGEGTDKERHAEIDELIRWNIFNRQLIGIHGVAMDEEQSKKLNSLIWCPVSNYFLLNATANIDRLKHHTNILFGTDSNVSADWNIWNHLRFAKRIGALNDEELYNSVTASPAKIWLNDITGKLEQGRFADLIIAKPPSVQDEASAFFSVNPEHLQMVIRNGEIVLFDKSLLPQLTEISVKNYSRFYIANNEKYVKGDLPLLIKQIRNYYPYAKFPIDVD